MGVVERPPTELYQVAQIQLENRSGYRRETFMKWRTGTHGATVFALEAALNALGYELKVVKKEKENADS